MKTSGGGLLLEIYWKETTRKVKCTTMDRYYHGKLLLFMERYKWKVPSGRYYWKVIFENVLTRGARTSLENNLLELMYFGYIL